MRDIKEMFKNPDDGFGDQAVADFSFLDINDNGDECFSHFKDFDQVCRLSMSKSHLQCEIPCVLLH